jgi:hypothetical protein
MFGQIVEVRSTNDAFEMRNGQRMEFATDEAGQQRRLRALGCPQHLIKGVIARAKRGTTPRSLREIDNEIARLNGLLAKKVAAAAKPLTQAERIARVTKAVAADIPFLNSCAEQERQQKADDELRERMENAAGITNRRRKYQPN